MQNEQFKPRPSSDQIRAAWKGIDPEDMRPFVARTAPAQAIIYFTATSDTEIYASGADFPGDIPFGD